MMVKAMRIRLLGSRGQELVRSLDDLLKIAMTTFASIAVLISEILKVRSVHPSL